MNWAHVHLLLNHVPVLGTIFGLALLGYALMRRNDGLTRVALGVFVVVALLALPGVLERRAGRSGRGARGGGVEDRRAVSTMIRSPAGWVAVPPTT